MTPAAVRSLIVALGIVVAGCGAAPIPSAPTVATPDATTSEPSSMAIDDAVCRLERQPGPDDRPLAGGGDLIDTSDRGGGRWRLCLDAPVPLVVEGSASCTWNDGRTAVTEASGLPVEIGPGAGTIDGGLSLEQGDVYLSQTGRTGDVSSWQGGPPGQLIQPSADRSSGVARFRAAALIDPEHPPAIRPPDQVGTIRWACDEPPTHRPGRSTGLVALRLDAPIGGAWQVQAMCNWIVTPAGPRLRGVETHPPLIRYDEAKLGILVSPNADHNDRVDVALWVDRTSAGDFYQPVETQVVVRQAHDGSTGLVRLRHLAIDPSSEVRITDDVTDVSGVVSWTCPPPPVPGTLDDGGPAGEDPELRPGRATITFTPRVAVPVEGPITCTIDRSNAPTLQVRGLRGSIPALGGRYELLADGLSVVLALVGADGQPAGEYVGDALRFSDDPTQPDLELVVSPIVFEPTDPRYIPLGGPDGPRSVRLEIDYSCQL